MVINLSCGSVVCVYGGAVSDIGALKVFKGARRFFSSYGLVVQICLLCGMY